MNILPELFERRMKNLLGEEAVDFFQALQTEPPVSIRLNPGKYCTEKIFPSIIGNQVPWCDDAFYLKERPAFTLDPCLHGGAYYVQEASSMFLDHILKQIMPSGPLRVLDLCAAPGGKSTLLSSVLSPDSLLVSNEVIRSRATILKENIIKWGTANTIVTGSDPSDFSGMKGAFDIIVVDAPCSGEGMFRKDTRAIEEWSENNLKLCSERQKRILSDIWNSLKPQGYLIYSTCTYNRGENEEILEWMQKEFDAESIEIEHSFNEIATYDSSAIGYHFYPHKTIGEGFFTGVVRKNDGEEWTYKKSKKQRLSKPAAFPAEINLMIKQDMFTGYENENIFGIIPALHEEFIAWLETQARVIYKGCEAVEINNKKLKFLPPLALYNGIQKEQCNLYEADLSTALTYLKKEDIQVPAAAGEWILITYQGIGLGWGKSLGNRLNNYYPKEWRIRMDIKGFNQTQQYDDL